MLLPHFIISLALYRSRLPSDAWAMEVWALAVSFSLSHPRCAASGVGSVVPLKFRARMGQGRNDSSGTKIEL